MSFDDVRLPVTVERGSRGGPRFNTTVFTLDSGFEKRNINWTRLRHAYNVGYGVTSKALFSEVVRFFIARQGRAYGFRFKDWADYQATTENIGTGNGSQVAFQLRKAYGDSARTFYRQIQKPVSGTNTFFVNSVEDANVTLDLATGVVTFGTAPGNGLPVTWTGEFDVPVRFDTDDLEVDLVNFDAGSVPNIPIVEILQELA